MSEISGIPAHPLFVHIPVVLLPLAAILAIVLLIKQAWFERYQWVLLGLVGIGTIGAVLAAASGEELEEAGERGRGIQEHAEAGEMARNVSFLFLLVVLAWIFVPKLLRRRAGDAGTSGSPDSGARNGALPSWFRPVVAAFVLLAGIGSVVTVIEAGHSGAEQVWNEEEGGQGDDGDHDDDGDEHEEEGEEGSPSLVPSTPLSADAASAG